MGHSPIWVQTIMTVMVRNFERVVLLKNICKTKLMVCVPGFI